jgi:hypothetical protein
VESLVLDRTAPPLVSVVKPKLRLGLLLDSTRVSKYVLQFVKWTQTQDQLEITCLLLHPPKQNPEPFGLADFVQPLKGSRRDSTLAKLLFRFIIGLEKILLRKAQRFSNHLQKFDLTAVLPNDRVPQLLVDQIASPASLGLDL